MKGIKSIISALMAGILVFTMSTNTMIVKASEITLIDAAKTQSITLDGNLTESIWAQTQNLSHRIVGDTTDINAKFGVTWDNQNMYIGVEVTGAATSKTDFNSDSISYYVAPYNFRGTPYSKDDFQVQIFNKGTLIKSGAAGVGKNDSLKVSDIKVKYKSQSSGYTMEIAMPWTVVGTMPKQSSNEMGFDIMAFSGDGEKCVMEWGEGTWIDTTKNGTLKYLCDGSEDKTEISVKQPIFEVKDTIEIDYKGTSQDDKIAVFKKGEEASSDKMIASKFTKDFSQPNGELSFTAQDIALNGEEEYKDGLPQGQYVAVVLKGDSNAMIGSTNFEVGTIQIKTNKRIYQAADKDDITITYCNTSPKDWVGIYEADVTPSGTNPSIVWQYTTDTSISITTDASITFTMNDFLASTHLDYAGKNIDYLNPGRYKAVLLENDGYSIKGEFPFVVKEAENTEISIDDAFYDVDFNITVNYKNTTTDKDWIGIYKKGTTPSSASEDAAYAYKYAPNGNGSVTFTRQDVINYIYAPEADRGKALPAGDYQFVLMYNDGYSILDRVDFTLTDLETRNPPKGVIYNITAAKPGYAEGSVTIEDDSLDPNVTSYVLYWGNEQGKLSDYNAIVRLNKDTKTYNMVKNTYIPSEATKLLAYSSNGVSESKEYVSCEISQNARLATSGLINKFEVVSDNHIVTWEGVINNRFDAALKDIVSNAADSQGVFIVGDTVDVGAVDNYDILTSIVAANKSGLPAMYYAIGNHEYFENISTPHQSHDLTCAEKAKRFLAYTGMPNLYYDKYINGQHFIVLGSEHPEIGGDITEIADDAYISDRQFAWLEAKLAETKDKKVPIFVFLHQSLEDTVAGSIGGKNGQGWNGLSKEQDAKLRSILFKYPQVTLFNGHSHWDMESAHEMYDGGSSEPSIFNTAATCMLWTDAQENKEGSQGLFVETYPDKILVRGRDFENKKWIPAAAFVIDLTEKYGTSSDEKPPVITGASDKTIYEGSVFDALSGVAAVDDVDGDLTSKLQISGLVDTSIANVYALTYKVSDAAGNEAMAVRQIKVIKGSNPSSNPGSSPSSSSGTAVVEKQPTLIERKQQLIKQVNSLSQSQKQEFVQKLLNNIPYTVRKGITQIHSNEIEEEIQNVINQDVLVLGDMGIDLNKEVDIVEIKQEENKQFKDIKENHWAFDVINSLVEQGIVKGYPDDTFKPKEQIIVSDTFVFLNRVLLLNNIESMKLSRKTVEKYITDKKDWAFYSKASIGSKLSETTLAQIAALKDEPLSRELLAQVLYEITDGKLKKVKELTLFKDINTSLYKDAINYCIETGLLTGMPNSNMEPERPITRAELMTILSRLDKALK